MIINFRRTNTFYCGISVYLDIANQELHINTEAGRFMRPVLIVKNRKLIVTRNMIEESLRTLQKDYKGDRELRGWKKLYEYVRIKGLQRPTS